MSRFICCLCSLVFATVTYSAEVYIYEWESTGGFQAGSKQKMYVGNTGLVVEQFEPGATEPTSDIVVLRDGRVIMNDRLSNSSSIMDPNNMPDMSGAAAAMQEAQAEMQRAMADMTPEQREAMQQAMSGILSQQGGGSGFPSLGGLLGGASEPPPPPTLRTTGNSGTQAGMSWEEVEFQMMGTNHLYRVADWSAIEGAELVSEHYAAMSRTFQGFMDGMGMADMTEGLGAWPQQIAEYMTTNRKFPVYIQQGNDTQQLMNVTSGTLDDGRFGAQFPVRSLGF